MSYQIVTHVLDACHNVQIILRTLKPKLKTIQFTKSPNTTDEAVHQIIKRELYGPSAGHGISSRGINTRQHMESK